MLPIPKHRFVVLELVISGLWLFDVAITGNWQIHRLTDMTSTVTPRMHEG